MSASDDLMLAQLAKVQTSIGTAKTSAELATLTSRADEIIRFHRGDAYQAECSAQAKRELVEEAEALWGSKVAEQLARKLELPWPVAAP